MDFVSFCKMRIFFRGMFKIFIFHANKAKSDFSMTHTFAPLVMKSSTLAPWCVEGVTQCRITTTENVSSVRSVSYTHLTLPTIYSV